MKAARHRVSKFLSTILLCLAGVENVTGRDTAGSRATTSRDWFSRAFLYEQNSTTFYKVPASNQNECRGSIWSEKSIQYRIVNGSSCVLYRPKLGQHRTASAQVVGADTTHWARVSCATLCETAGLGKIVRVRAPDSATSTFKSFRCYLLPL